MKNNTRTLTRGVVVSIAAIALVLTVAAIPAMAVPPTVSSFNPTTGSPGTLVAVTGIGFTAGTGVSSVTFNGTATTFNVTDDQHLTTTVPIGATTGKIVVTTSNGPGTSATDFVVPASLPTITGFSPTSGPPGTSVSINGTHFTGVNGVKFNGVGATFNFVSDAQVSTTVPIGATTGKITLTTPAGLATSVADFTVGSGSPPTISSFSPTSGAAGASVTINGNHLTGVNSVKFNGTATGFSFVNDGRVTATVPSGATTGQITLTTPSGMATSAASFTVTSVAPTISSFSPTSGAAGASVTINGSHFTGVNGVKFNGTSAGFAFVSDTKVTTNVPSGATTGKITLTTPSGMATSSGTFTVTAGSAPTISSFSPTSGGTGTSVTINGSHFTGVNGVKFNGTTAGFAFVSDTKVTTNVPSGATTGKITLTTPAGSATSASTFTVTTSAPTISSFSPSSGVVGTKVTIYGNHFTGINGVKFNGTSAGFSFANDGRVTATVPNGATTGRITLTTTNGTATSGSNFTVTGGGNHERSVSLKISGRYASGRVGVNDGYSACSSNVPVVIKHYRHGDWHWVTTTSTRSDGTYRALIGGRNGRYRARAMRITLVNGAVCQGDQSPTVQH